MSEFFLELFSEEMPSSLQRNARENLLKKFCEFFSAPIPSKMELVFLTTRPSLPAGTAKTITIRPRPKPRLWPQRRM